jgi:ATP-dependent RNA helicase DeaD
VHQERRQERRGGDRKPMSSYRIEVGKRHRVEPRQIVGALANEGGLSREDFGKIDIRPAFSIVELPAYLPADTLRALEDTRISGVLIDLKPDRFARNRGSTRPQRPRTTGEAGQKKPRHKNRIQ